MIGMLLNVVHGKIQNTNSGIEGEIKYVQMLIWVLDIIFGTCAFRLANHRSPIQVSSLPPPSPSADNKLFPV